MRLSLLTPSLARAIDRDRERGATLLVSIAILTLLFVFSIAFVRLVSFERTASANYTDSVRARMLARAGIERAVTEMQRIALKRHYSHPGDPITAPNVDPLTDPPATPIPPPKAHDGWAYSDTLQNDSPQKGTYSAATREFTFAGRNFALDLHSTLRPSFRMQDQTRTLYGDRLTYSGIMGSSYAQGADIYKLKVLDTQRMLDLNHPDQVAARRMLKNLLLALGVGNAQALANAVIDRRPASGFRSKAEVEALMVNGSGGTGTGMTAEFYRANVRDLITVYAYRDEKVIRPWAINSISGDISTDLGTVTGSVGGTPINLVEPAQRQLTLATQRSPINLNTAPRAVLVAMFAEAKAVSERYGTFSITFPGAQALAGAIIARRQGTAAGQGPFRTWNEFEAFVDGLNLGALGGFVANVETVRDNAQMFGGTPPHRRRSEVPDGPNRANGVIYQALITHNQGCKDLIKAVANPNTMVTKFGIMPNHGGGLLPTGVRVPRLIDKSDLTSLTTEGCFDAMGVFEITSIGMVLIPGVDPTDLKIVAAQTEQKVVRIYDVFRLSTQQDFEQNRALMVKGDFIEANDNKRAGPMIPGSAPPPLTWPYTVHGTNKQAFQGYVIGWPGMVSWPSYSIDRQDRVDSTGQDLPTGIAYSPKPNYVMAHWDGHLTLSNLIAYVMQDMDFVIGFARGKLEAFKVRSWWDPRNQYHNGVGYIADPSGNGDEDADGFVDEIPSRPHSQDEITALATPLNKQDLRSRMVGIQNPAEAQLIDEDLAGTATLTANDLFLDGSSLWNTGVAIHPFRRFKGTGPANDLPQFICYDSGNLDLIQGFSMRFWAQPQVDAFLQDEEVLCTFVGSRGNHTGFNSLNEPEYSDRGVDPTNPANSGANAREVGFRVFKLTTGSQVYISLETVGDWVFGGQTVMNIDVTPTTGVNNPIQPQWFPGSWHWIVINQGPRGDYPGTHDISLQVDMAQFRTGLPLYGSKYHGSSAADESPRAEVHGYERQWGVTPYERGPMDSGARTAVYFRAVHLLGDWYNCEGGGNVTQNVTTTSTPYGPNAVVVDSTGNNYTTGPNWPPSPFPVGSYDHEIILTFAVAPGDTSGATPPANQPMTQSGGGGFSGWSHTFAGTQMGTDTVPGGHEWAIGVIVRYKETAYTGSFCNCCEGPPLPNDPGYPGPDPRNKFMGAAQGCNHDTSGSMKSGYGTIGDWPAPPNPGDPIPPPFSGYFCWVASKGPTPLGPFSGYTPAPSMEFQCDDCHGCESCDLDGPIFFGGEPRGDQNYNGQNDFAAPQSYELSTMAHVTIDNIVIMNNQQRRTDNYSENTREFYEDRFYETTMAYLIGNPGGANTPNFGAQYHRALFELIGRRARIGTLTWTAYTSTENLRFELGLYSVDAFDAPLPTGGTTFRLDNPGILASSTAPFTTLGVDQFSDSPIGGSAHPSPVTDSAMTFGEAGIDLSGAMYDGEGVPTVAAPKLLILGVRLRDTPPAIDPTSDPSQAEYNGADGAGAQIAGQDPGVVRSGNTVVGPGGFVAGGLRGPAVPQPLLSTPIFEDFTMTLIPDRTTTLYAEEGVEE